MAEVVPDEITTESTTTPEDTTTETTTENKTEETTSANSQNAKPEENPDTSRRVIPIASVGVIFGALAVVVGVSTKRKDEE